MRSPCPLFTINFSSPQAPTFLIFFFFKNTPPPEFYPLPLHDPFPFFFLFFHSRRKNRLPKANIIIVTGRAKKSSSCPLNKVQKANALSTIRIVESAFAFWTLFSG